MSTQFKDIKRLVVKLGTNLLTSGGGNMDTARVGSFCKQIAEVKKQGVQVIIVSSGAVGLGMGKLGMDRRPVLIEKLQSCAAVGQSILTQTWQGQFDPFEIVVGQILLTRDDVRGRKRHVAIKNTLENLLSLGIIPIINENDSISAEELEIRFGDNDILSALLASLVKADALAILTSVDGLLDLSGDGELIRTVETITPEIEAMALGTTSATAVGGMSSKVEAAKVATHSGCRVFIGNGSTENILVDLVNKSATGTYFTPADSPPESKKLWLAHFADPEGTITVDAGAEIALRQNGSSLLAKGIIACEGTFLADTLVNIANQSGDVFARGKSQFSNEQLSSVLGKSSKEITELFPESKRADVIHRDEMVIL